MYAMEDICTEGTFFNVAQICLWNGDNITARVEGNRLIGRNNTAKEIIKYCIRYGGQYRKGTILESKLRFQIVTMARDKLEWFICYARKM